MGRKVHGLSKLDTSILDSSGRCILYSTEAFWKPFIGRPPTWNHWKIAMLQIQWYCGHHRHSLPFCLHHGQRSHQWWRILIPPTQWIPSQQAMNLSSHLSVHGSRGCQDLQITTSGIGQGSFQEPFDDAGIEITESTRKCCFFLIVDASLFLNGPFGSEKARCCCVFIHLI